VNGIERDLGGQAKVVRIELLSASGRELARRFDVRAIPTLLVFDGEKNLVHRYEGVPNRKEVVAQVKALR
jgi:thioredoxin-related protein